MLKAAQAIRKEQPNLALAGFTIRNFSALVAKHTVTGKDAKIVWDPMQAR